MKKNFYLDSELLFLCEKYGSFYDHNKNSNITARVSLSLSWSLKMMEKIIILATLREHQYHRKRAAQSLGISLRSLQRKIRQYKQEEQL